MIAKLAKSIAHFFVEKEIVNSEDEEVYVYGMELLFSTLFNIILAVIIGAVTSSMLETAIFLAAFISVRQCIGGYHAETYWGCISIFGVVLIAFATIVKLTPEAFVIPISIASTIVSFILVLLFAPVEHPNKPLSDKEKFVLRKKGITLLSIISAIILILVIFPDLRRYGMYISLGGVTSAIAMVCQKIKNCRNSSS